jgi:putative intracellular protease/amidase
LVNVERLETRALLSATPMEIGMNLDNVNDYTPNWMFTDVFQSSRPWISHAYNTVTQGADFNGGAFIPVQTDANGWPMQLATWTNAHGHLMQQRLGTLMFRDLNGNYPAGTYRVEWDGTGDVVFNFDARETSRGRTADGHNFALLNVTPGNGGIYLGINSMSSTDPIRDIHVWMPDYNGQSFAGQRWTPGANFSPFHPLYKERLDDFGILRFMQTQETVTSDIRTWADRRDVSDSRQSSGNGGPMANGISVEHMVQLANELDADPWFNMPHMADDTFVRNFATYVRDNLEPGLTAYVEWSNEIWNSAPGFETYFWIADQIRLPENSGLTHWQFAGREAARDMDVWSEVFAGQTDRIVRVTAGQATTPWVTERIVENMGGSFDAISIAPYFGPSEAQRATYSAATTVDQVLNDMRGNIAFSAQMTLNHQRLADDFSTRLGRDIQVLAYEGGPHLNGNGASYQNALFQATKDPRMADITRDYLRMQNAAGLDAYVHYKLTDRDLATQYGLFGVLLGQDQPLSEAHMYRALLDADSGSLFTSTPTLVTLNAADPQAHEAGLGTASFRVTRGGNLSLPLTVNYSASGNAIAGTDYNALSGTVTFPANENTAFITVTPRDDATIEASETVTVTLQPGVGYSLIGSAASTGNVSIVSDDLPSTLSTITVVATDPNAAEAGRDPGVFTVTRTGGNTAGTLTVYLQNGFQTAQAADYDSFPLSVTFAAGQTSATLTVRPVDDTTVENTESVILTINPTTLYRIGANGAARVNIADNDVTPPPVTPIITVAATDATANEVGNDNGTFTLTRTGALNNTLVVRYTANGTATAGQDFAPLSGFAYFAWGQATTTVAIYPYDDRIVEAIETVTVSLSDGDAYDLGTARTATVNISSDEVATALPTVTIFATDASAAEAGRDPALFTVTRPGGSTGAALNVRYTVTGTATSGSDFTALSGAVTIPAGQVAATVRLDPIDDMFVENSETVILTLLDGDDYDLGSASTSTANIASDDLSQILPTVQVQASDGYAAEANLDPAVFLVQRSSNVGMSQPLVVNYTISGTARNGSDYSRLSGSVTIPAGVVGMSIAVTPIDDAEVEQRETIILRLAASPAYRIGAAASATAILDSNDLAVPQRSTVTIATTDPTAAEAGRDPATFTVTRTGGDTSRALTVTYVVTGAATNGSDYTQLSGTVAFAAGQTSATVTVTPVDDTTTESNETVIVTLQANATYLLGSSTTATGTIADNDAPTQQPLPVLLVIANNDFYYTEYSEPRAQFEAAGIPVVVAAGRRELSTPHANSGQGSTSGQVMPDIALADANATNYSAIVFVGGWGASQYQYAFPGTYNNAAYNSTPVIRERVNQLINDFVAQDKLVTGVCHGVSVLAWARVNGQSLLQGRTVTTAHFNSPANNIPDANLYRWHSEVNGATVFTGGVLGNASTRNDDVVVDGRIITGENFDSARQFGITIAERIRNGAATIATISATDSTAAEANRETGTLTVVRTGSTAAALAVNYSLGGTATNGTDYDNLRGTIIIEPGQTTAAITVRPTDDSVNDPVETATATLTANSAYNLGATTVATVSIADNDAPTQQRLPVLMVIANQDFYYQEYGDTRLSLEEAGFTVQVAAATRTLAQPHANSGQGAASGNVMPDLTLAQANAANFSTIVFVGGWGASSYQYGFSGTYSNTAYNGDPAVELRVNELINDFTRQNKYIAALCHGVSVLAWARIDTNNNGTIDSGEVSPIAGRTVVAYAGSAPPSNVASATTTRWHVESNGATMPPSRSVGNTSTDTDDVLVSGRIITAENYNSARQFGRVIATELSRTM